MLELVAAQRPSAQSLPLMPVYLGEEQCEPGHAYGRVREHYLIHYVLHGRGAFWTQHGMNSLEVGDAFLVQPGQEHWYRADAQFPWKYVWFAFAAPEPPILADWVQRDSLPAVVHTTRDQRSIVTRAYRRLWYVVSRQAPPLEMAEALIAVLRALMVHEAEPGRDEHASGPATPTDVPASRGVVSHAADQNSVWARARAFMEAHYAEPITLDAICRTVGISRVQLHRLSRAHTGNTPKEELTRLRMNRAVALLADSDRPVHRIASLVGYREYQTFERQFVRYWNMTPTACRRRGGVG